MRYTPEITEIFKWFFDKGYITHRDGNACVLIENEKAPDTYLVTASGANKPHMYFMDFVLVDSEGNQATEHMSKYPSIETMAHIHAQKASHHRASIHVHSPNTVALFHGFTHHHSKLEDIINNQWPEVFRYTKIGTTVPFLDPGSEELHECIANSFKSKKPDIVVLDKHGVLAVGQNLQQCVEHIVRLEHVSSILLKSGILQNK